MLEENEKTESPKPIQIGMPEYLLLDSSCHIINEAFNDTCYLVGSCLNTKDFRDVDVRMIMDDDKFERFFGDVHPAVNACWSLICMSISLYLKHNTGLRVDFQIQKRSRVKESDWKKPRYSMGFYVRQKGKKDDDSAEG